MWSMSLNQVVCFYQCWFTTFQILFLCTQYTLRCLIFSKQFWIIDKWSYSTVKQTNETQYVYGYICLLLEKHMAKRVRTISWKYKASFKYDFEWCMNKRDYNSWKYFICGFWNKSVVYLLSFTKEYLVITVAHNPLHTSRVLVYTNQCKHRWSIVKRHILNNLKGNFSI